MATVVLATAGRIVGTAIGGPLGGQIGQAIGATVGGMIDQRVFGPTVEGPRLKEVQITTSTEGAGITRLYGRCRLGGQMIWATKFKENKVKSTTGGKGGQKTASYTYTCSFAVAFCEGNGRAQLGRVWADGKVLDLGRYATRFYTGAANQPPDPLIQSIEGADETPAFRGVSYLVFEDCDLTDFGNRIPQITAEMTVPLGEDNVSDLIEGVTMIPATGSFAYATEGYIRRTGLTTTESENIHNGAGKADVLVALDQLESALPNCDSVSLVVAWFGDDLRCGECELKPRLAANFGDYGTINWLPTTWEVDGQGPYDVPTTSIVDGRSVYGSTPDDSSVIALIEELKARGKRVVFYPFILMDIQEGNGLPDPYGGSEQPINPWRGRITCMPAPGEPGTVDKTSAAGDQVDEFFTREWGYNRFIEHYANLCAEAGGVDAFIIASELVNLTTVRDSATTFPAVGHLQSIAATVKGILPAAEVSYAADWSEYHSYRPGDGSGDVFFHLDPLWADDSIDFVGIDNYLPISDIRDGSAESIYDLDYLKENIESGEYFDWFYASMGDRIAGDRTPITDGAYGKPWVFRNKDIRSWWTLQHRNRPGGVESGSPTAWTPRSKPIWFTEFGCPAVDKGTNQPNVFYDPRSSESSFPYFSSGIRDDVIQRRYIEAMVEYWRDEAPFSPEYLGPMISTENMFVWTWDSRPYPAFPYLTDVWGDGPNYDRGHWINGRIGSETPLGELIKAIAKRGLPEQLIDVTNVAESNVTVTGYYSDQVNSPRGDLAPLLGLFFVDAHESDGLVKFVLRGSAPTFAVTEDDLVPSDGAPTGIKRTRAQPFELPGRFVLTFVDELNDFQTASAPGVLETGNSADVATMSAPLVLRQEDAKGIADAVLQDAWLSQESGEFTIPPSLSAAEPGDVLTVDLEPIAFRITSSTFGGSVQLSGKGTDPTAYVIVPGGIGNPGKPTVPSVFGPVILEFMDLPLVDGTEPDPQAPRLASMGNPWPGTVAVLKANGSGGFNANANVTDPSIMGELTSALGEGPRFQWDEVNEIELQLYSDDELASVAEIDALAGANALAVKTPTGLWEVILFQNAELTGTRQYRLSRLIRGKLGTENEMLAAPYPIGSRVVILEPETLGVLGVTLDQRNLTFDYRYGPAAYPQDNVSYQNASYAAKAVGLRPYAPVHVRMTRDSANDDLTITWVRRTRFGGDSLDDPAPLNEESEAYQLDILDGADVVRTLSSTAPSVVYSAADQTADFGSVQTSLHLVVYQMSAAIGRGSPAERTINA